MDSEMKPLPFQGFSQDCRDAYIRLKFRAFDRKFSNQNEPTIVKSSP